MKGEKGVCGPLQLAFQYLTLHYGERAGGTLGHFELAFGLKLEQNIASALRLTQHIVLSQVCQLVVCDVDLFFVTEIQHDFRLQNREYRSF